MDNPFDQFLDETRASLADLDRALVTLERAPRDRETLSLVLRLVRRIDSACGHQGLPRLARLTSAVAAVPGMPRDGSLVVTPGIVFLLQRAIDRARTILAVLDVAGAEPEGDDTVLIAELDAVVAGCRRAATPPQLIAPRAAIGHRHSTRPARIPTYQS